MDLFEHADSDMQNSPDKTTHAPLAEILRPRTIAEFLGQKRLSDPKQPLLKNLKERNYLPNLILWGPPGTGKTTFAHLVSQEARAFFISCNAVETGAKELRIIGNEAHDRRLQQQKKTLLFVDEIHRLNKSQQDVLLPFTEKGDLTLIGATTENPSYELNSALLSRSQVLIFDKLLESDLQLLLERAARYLQIELTQILTSDAIEAFLRTVSGDARKLLNNFEILAHHFKSTSGEVAFPLTLEKLNLLQFSTSFHYDKSGAEHYDTVSAFIKSVRGSDPDAAIYYLARMLTGGEDPVFIARRLVISASEDIGNADPKALPLAIAALQAVELVGMPEARICLAQATTYMASAPKSNRCYEAINKAISLVETTGALSVPLSLRSSKTTLTKSIGYGQGYRYSHNSQKGYIEQKLLPDELLGEKFYEPSDHGFEKNIKQYLEWLKS